MIKVSLQLLFFFTIAVLAADTFAADSYQINHTNTATIDEHGTCYMVTNNSGQSLFVPTRTSAEWSSFYNNLPAGVTTGGCFLGTLLQSSQDTVDRSTYTFSGQSLGAAAAGRVIVVGIIGNFAQTNVFAPTVTIGGVAATIHEYDVADEGNWGIRVVLASATVPTGTSGSIVVTWSKTARDTQVVSYRVVGASGSAPTYSGIATNAFDFDTHQNITSFQEAADGFTVFAGGWEGANCDYNIYSGAHSSTSAFAHTMIDTTNSALYSSAYRSTSASLGPTTINVTYACGGIRGKGYVWGHWN